MQRVGVSHINADAGALFTLCRLHHNRTVSIHECARLLFILNPDLRRHAQSGLAQYAVRGRLVIAAAHGDRGGQFAQGFAANDTAAAETQFEVTALGVEDLDIDATLQCLASNDARVGIQVVPDVVAGEQGFVVRVFVLEREHGHALETEILVKPDGVGIIVHYRQIKVGAAACQVVLGKLTHQGLADAGYAGLRVHCQRPEAGAALRIVKSGLVIDTGDGSE